MTRLASGWRSSVPSRGWKRVGRRRRALTLMEVLAAMLLVAIVLPAAMAAITTSLRAAEHARRLTEASQLAANRIAELLTAADASELSGSGDFGDAWPDYAWNADAVGKDRDLYEVTVTVTWQERGQSRDMAVSTLVLPRDSRP